MRSSAVFALCLTGLLLPALVEAQNVGCSPRLRHARRGGQGFSGVVRIDRDGATLLRKGYGLANREARVPFTPSTVVQIGSNTKDFTAIAILQLDRWGRLSLRDTLGKFFAAPPDKRGITIAQLLDHEAGFPRGLGGDFES